MTCEDEAIANDVFISTTHSLAALSGYILVLVKVKSFLCSIWIVTQTVFDGCNKIRGTSSVRPNHVAE